MGKEQEKRGTEVMSSTEDMILEELRYIRGKVDTIAPMVNSDHQRLEDHLAGHSQGPDKVAAGAAVISVIIAILAIMIASGDDNDEKKDYRDNMDRSHIERMHEYPGSR